MASSARRDVSSPHARGSSRVRRTVALGRARPRTRGGLPCQPPAGRGQGVARPRTRGGLPVGMAVDRAPAPRPRTRGGLPASSPVSPGRRPRPRTRGGLPRSPARRCCPRSSSPHARGSSPAVPVLARPDLLVPARAGVFPRIGWSATSRTPRPRTRGGLPRSTDVPAPHRLVPARAGVFPHAREVRRARRSRPRTRGGVPIDGRTRCPGSQPSSPHARGCSASRSGPIAARPRPRTRGGLPTRPRCRPRPAVVPARAGVFPVGTVRRAHVAALVPARAGVFLSPEGAVMRVRPRPRTRGGLPSLLVTVLVRCSRPRTRGGVPGPVLYGWQRVYSSPHARGSSPAQHSHDGRVRLVPALAGVFHPGVHRSP